jgi:hypothetical protein
MEIELTLKSESGERGVQILLLSEAVVYLRSTTIPRSSLQALPF